MTENVGCTKLLNLVLENIHESTVYLVDTPLKKTEVTICNHLAYCPLNRGAKCLIWCLHYPRTEIVHDTECSCWDQALFTNIQFGSTIQIWVWECKSLDLYINTERTFFRPGQLKFANTAYSKHMLRILVLTHYNKCTYCDMVFMMLLSDQSLWARARIMWNWDLGCVSLCTSRRYFPIHLCGKNPPKLHSENIPLVLLHKGKCATGDTVNDTILISLYKRKHCLLLLPLHLVHTESRNCNTSVKA